MSSDYEKLAIEWCSDATPKAIRVLVSYMVKKVLMDWHDNIYDKNNITPEELAKGLKSMLDIGKQLIDQAEEKRNNVEKISMKYDPR